MKGMSAGAAIAWDIAVHEAAGLAHQYIEKEHLFIALVSLDKATTRSADELSLTKEQWGELRSDHDIIEGCLASHGVEAQALRRQVRSRMGRGTYVHAEKSVHRSALCKTIFVRGQALARPSGSLTAVHLFIAVLEDAGLVINAAIEADGNARADELFDTARNAFSGGAGKKEAPRQAGAGPVSKTPVLERYGRDLTQEAREGRLGPFIGRRGALLQIIQTLARSSKNNPVIVGEAGVGKTAVVEAIAMRIAHGKDADVLGGKRIIELNVGSLQAGTKYRGEFEDRITRIIAEAKDAPDVIVFIDELHNIVGAGRSEGSSMDAANLLKPALARGDFRCIGATTIAEYRRCIESDPALERRFEKVVINEPTRDETIEMLRGIRPKWEKHHGVRITDKAIEAAVDLSIRFDADHNLPDKAIDLVDKAGAAARIPVLSMIKGMRPSQPERSEAVLEVDELQVARVLAEKTGVPIEIISGNAGGDGARILGLLPYLKGRITGQGEAISTVCTRLMTAYSGVSPRIGPLAVFLFLGPTGVGKTEMAKAIAGFVFGEDAGGDMAGLIRLDMSEYMEEHSAAKLIGSPPGYVGYQEEGQLTGALRTNPHAVVLLDEVEKAHPRVFDLFLQLFDEGRLTDSKGRTIDGTSAIFIMTSNIGGARSIERPAGFLGQGDKSSDQAHEMLEEARRYFRPEFLNRIDEKIVFRGLDERDASRIVGKMLDELSAHLLKEQGVTLKVEAQAVEFLASAGFNPQFGARELGRTIERLVETPLALLVLRKDVAKSRAWKIVRDTKGVAIVPS